MTRIIRIERCIECPLRGQTRGYDDETVFICRHQATDGYQIPDTDVIPNFCPLEVIS